MNHRSLLCFLFVITLKVTAEYNVSTWESNTAWTELRGPIKMIKQRADFAQPGLASVWTPKKNLPFLLNIWPPEYCHAVYLCFIPAALYSDKVNFHTRTDACRDTYIKFFPWAKQVKYKLSTSPEQTSFYQQSDAYFEATGIDKFALKLYQKESFTLEEFKNAERVPVLVDLYEKNILLLTNSRYCTASIIQSNEAVTYYPLFNPETARKSNFDEVINNFDAKKYHKSLQHLRMSDSNAAGSKIGSPNIVDLLPELKTIKPKPVKKGSCNKFTIKEATLSKKKGTVSKYPTVHSTYISQALVSGSKLVRTFLINMNQCSWFRLWVTPNDMKAGDYNKMRLEDTLTMFLDFGFYIAPQSTLARPLRGNSKAIREIRFVIDPYKKNNTIIQISYGKMRKNYLFYEHVDMPALVKDSYMLHLIRSPMCDATLIDAISPDLYKTNNDKSETQKFGKCEYSIFK